MSRVTIALVSIAALYFGANMAFAQHVQIISATSFCDSGLPGIVECPAYNALREWPGFDSAPIDVWYKVKAHDSSYPGGSYNGSALCRPTMGLTAECTKASVSYSATATKPRPLTATPPNLGPDDATYATGPETMETRTYLGVDAINAISAACVDFSYSELRTITDYSYAAEVLADLDAEGYVMCVTWAWDQSNDCTGTAYGNGNPRIPAGDELIFDYAENKKVCVVPSGSPTDTDWTLTLGLADGE